MTLFYKLMHYASLKFHPIGQGCFYTGDLRKHGGLKLFNFVYDCGTNSDQEYLSSAIASTPVKKNGESINVCIISHFHADHVSGIPQLLKGALRPFGDPLL